MWEESRPDQIYRDNPITVVLCMYLTAPCITQHGKLSTKTQRLSQFENTVEPA